MANSSAPACIEVDSETLWRRIEVAGPLDVLPVADGTPYFDDDGSSERRLSQADRRRTFIALYGWAVPTRQAMDAIRDFLAGDALLEVCAGSGLWARLLMDRGLRVVATDAYAPAGQPYTPIETMEAEAAVRVHPECRALFFCWPPFRQNCAYRAVTAFTGDKVVYAGDRRFTGDEKLQALLESEWALVRQIQTPAWPGLDDQVYLYSRR